jgi:uncharacterized Zn finger protein
MRRTRVYGPAVVMERMMGRFNYGYGYTQETAAEKRAKARKQLEKLKAGDPGVQPVVIKGRTVAKTWWGKMWIENLKRYADYESRIDRGSAYVINGMVLDLKISAGRVDAIVAGSRRESYKVGVTVKNLSQHNWDAIVSVCGDGIANMEQLAAGRFPVEFAGLFTQKGKGLFPSPEEIRFSCECPDWAYMCKHVAAVMYGVGARLDEDPRLFFTLRDVDFTELLKKSAADKMESLLKNAGRKTERVLEGADINKLFGV